MRQIIRSAIEELKILAFTYDGQPRVVEPHALGVTTKGNEAMRCYQTEGGSNSGKVPGWHLMKIEKIVGLQSTEEKFSGPRTGYKKGDSQLPTIYTEL